MKDKRRTFWGEWWEDAAAKRMPPALICVKPGGPVSTWRLVTKATGGGCIKCFTYKQPYYYFCSFSLTLFFFLHLQTNDEMRAVAASLKETYQRQQEQNEKSTRHFSSDAWPFAGSELARKRQKQSEKSNWNRKEEWQGWNHLDKFVQSKTEWVREEGEKEEENGCAGKAGIKWQWKQREGQKWKNILTLVLDSLYFGRVRFACPRWSQVQPEAIFLFLFVRLSFPILWEKLKGKTQMYEKEEETQRKDGQQ